jgi:hypothetical protein
MIRLLPPLVIALALGACGVRNPPKPPPGPPPPRPVAGDPEMVPGAPPANNEFPQNPSAPSGRSQPVPLAPGEGDAGISP